jgi:hypothetical protein
MQDAKYSNEQALNPLKASFFVDPSLPLLIPRLIRATPLTFSGLTPRSRPLSLVAYPQILAGTFRG